MKVKAKSRAAGRAKTSRPAAKSAAARSIAVTKRKAVKAAAKTRPSLRAETPAPRPVTPTPQQTMGVERQQELYEEAMRLFYAHKFDRADALFQKVLAGPDRTLAHHAQVHSKICANRLKQPEIQLRTAEDHYNYAVTLLNERKLEEATRHLESAVRMSPHSEHLHYALAAAAVARGDLDGACRRLKTAIDLEPQNRFRARSDPDFHASLDYPPMASLLQFDRGSAPGRERPGGE